MNTPVHATPTPSATSDVSTTVTGEIEAFLQDALARLAPDPGEDRRRGPGRPRILPALVLWAGLLICILRGSSEQRAIWRLLSLGQLWSYPRVAITDEAVYRRLESGGTLPMERLFAQITQVLQPRLAPYADHTLAPFAAEVVALDECTLDPVARLLPALRDLPPGDRGLLPGKLAGLFDLRRQQWLTIQQRPETQQNEKVAARDLIDALPVGSLILADLGYFGFAWFDDLTARHYHFVSRLRAKTSFVVQHVFYRDGETFDGIVFLGAYRADRAAHAVRLVQFRVGRTLFQYITNVLDPAVLTIRDIATLYARRWDIELAVLLVKQHLKLHLLWSSKTVVVQQQVWAVLIIAQILQALRLEIAGRAGVSPFDVSMALLVQYAPQCAAHGQDVLETFVTLGRDLGFIRPSRRTTIHAPDIPRGWLAPLPPDLPLVRTPRYANRKCTSRQTSRSN
jgi:hypothetical protein